MQDTAHRDIEEIGTEGTEIARYSTSAGERMVIGVQAPGGVELTDLPSRGTGCGYLIDRGFRCFEQLAAFVGDYVDQAVRLDACPMSREAIGAVLDCTEHEALAPLLGEEGPR